MKPAAFYVFVLSIIGTVINIGIISYQVVKNEIQKPYCTSSQVKAVIELSSSCKGISKYNCINKLIKEHCNE